ncbi:MAG: protein kinase [Acidobacteriota bacterium]
MSPDRWNKIDELLDVAMELLPERRASYLAEACAGDEELQREVESLLLAHEKSGAFIETTPAKGMAAFVKSFQFSPQEMIGRTFGHYRIEALLGAGGMGEVYQARDARLDRNVAIKVLPKHLSAHPDALTRFEREAKAIAALPHPNILAIHDFGREGGVTYAVTELLEGETLRQRIGAAEMAGIGWREAVKIAASVAEGLSAAHARGIIHRDIKPENIFLTADGVVKVLDFGIARVKKAVVSNAQTLISQGANDTKPGTLMGTIGYMSPEQVRGDNADAPSDIFSLGCVLVEMLTGERPFERNSAAETMAAILRDEPPSPNSIHQEIPPELGKIIHRCLQKTPEERFQSARDLAFELRSLLTGTSGMYRAASGTHRRVTGEIPALHTGSQRISLSPAWWIFGLLAITFSAIVFFGWRSKPVEVQPQNSLAVLPLINESDDKNIEFLSVGLADNIIANLSPLRPKLRVLASSSVSAYKGLRVDPRQAGRDLNVSAVLVGKVSRQNDLLVIYVELVDVADGSQMWSERYQRLPADLMEIQEDISRQISEKLQINLAGEERKLLSKRYTDNSEAYYQYLNGRYFWNQRTEESYEKAIEFYQKAISLDPNYALAYVGMADAYVLMYDGGPKTEEARRNAEQLARRALALDSQLAEAHATLGFTEMFSNRNWAEAEKKFKRAIELNNGYATAHHWYAILLAIHGRFEAAFDEIRRAREIDPRSFPINSDLGTLLYYARRYDEAIAQCRRTNESEPSNKSVRDNHFWIRNAFEAKGDLESAIKEMQIMTPPIAGIDELQQALAQGGKIGYWQKRWELTLRRPDQNSPSGRIRLIFANAAAGNIEQAMAMLEKSIAEDHHDGLMYLKVDPRFDNLRSHPRFPDALRRMKLLD